MSIEFVDDPNRLYHAAIEVEGHDGRIARVEFETRDFNLECHRDAFEYAFAGEGFTRMEPFPDFALEFSAKRCVNSKYIDLGDRKAMGREFSKPCKITITFPPGTVLDFSDESLFDGFDSVEEVFRSINQDVADSLYMRDNPGKIEIEGFKIKGLPLIEKHDSVAFKDIIG